MDEQPIYQRIAQSVRQEIQTGNLKPGDRLPSIREMTVTWHCTPGTVQRAFRELADQNLVVSRAGQGTHVVQTALQVDDTPLRRAGLVHMAQSFLLEAFTAGHSPEEVETAVQIALDQWRVIRAQPAPAVVNVLRFNGSHDLALIWIASHFGEISHQTRLDLHFSGSLGGLIALAEGRTDMAGCHLWDQETDSYNIPFVRRLLPGQLIALLTLAWRWQGLIMPAGNPARINGLADLAREGLRFVNRQPGSGTRVWLDSALQQKGVPAESIDGYQMICRTHSEVARVVAEGEADVGFGLETAARAFGLGFIPLVKERYDLVIPEQNMKHNEVDLLVKFLKHETTRKAISALGGYDTQDTGMLTWVHPL